MKDLTLKTFIDSENIEYKLFVNAAGTATIRVRDLDANENVSLVKYPIMLAAEMEFAKLVAKVQMYQDGGPMVEITDNSQIKTK